MSYTGTRERKGRGGVKGYWAAERGSSRSVSAVRCGRGGIEIRREAVGYVWGFVPEKSFLWRPRYFVAVRAPISVGTEPLFGWAGARDTWEAHEC